MKRPITGADHEIQYHLLGVNETVQDHIFAQSRSPPMRIVAPGECCVHEIASLRAYGAFRDSASEWHVGWHLVVCQEDGFGFLPVGIARSLLPLKASIEC